VLNSHEQSSKNFQTPLNIFIIGLSASAIFPASVKAISSIVPTAAIPEKSAILMAQQPQEIQFKRGASSAEVKGGVARGEVMIYLINAKEGQWILDFRF
jgi:hypothetical protein